MVCEVADSEFGYIIEIANVGGWTFPCARLCLDFTSSPNTSKILVFVRFLDKLNVAHTRTYCIRTTPTMDQDATAQSFMTAYNKAQTPFDNDELEACVAECQTILEESDIPCYDRIKMLILLGCCMEDLTEVGECYREATRVCKDSLSGVSGWFLSPILCSAL